MDPYPSSSSLIAQKTWELENNIITVDTPPASTNSAADASSDSIFYYDETAQAKFQQDRPWVTIPTTSGASRSLLSRFSRWWCTLDPVETETRVNAQADAYEYMVDYSQTNKQAGRLENVVGWYHSHPGYGCWLLYYALDITYFKSSLDCHLLDLLWNKYWVNTLSSSPLLGNADYVAGQISDLAEKLEQAENQLAHSRFGPLVAPPQRKKEEESQLAKITRDSAKITVETGPWSNVTGY
ncbi:hypothetical protein GH714_011933 [Hevea brasiliensis]|uniref:MPN domain-containing protein n=1 Tax=Hevea brasiliensis TaxID=3981 RepID=A0A6A6K550_HEVBR|nr:hypothetical protein GH714_011933 [Hevea brasiliensis]